MAEPIAALIVRILADTSEMVTGVKNVSGQLDAMENRVGKFGKVLAGVFTVQAVAGFAKEILADVDRIDTAAKRLGASTDEFQRFSFAIKQSGGDAATATAGIVSLTEKLGSGDAGLFSVLRKLNINLDEFKAKDAVARFVELATAINGVSDPTQRLELRLEALGAKGEKALAAIDENFRRLADNAPTYSAETIQALKRIEDGWDRLWTKFKAGSAELAVAFKDFLDPTKTQVIDADGNIKFFSGTGETPAPPKSPLTAPPALGPGGVDPNDAKALAVAFADLDLQMVQVQASTKNAKEEFDATNAVLKMLKMEVGNLAGAMVPLMEAFGTTTKVDQFAQRIMALAQRSAELRAEQERLMEVIAPGSSKFTGSDDVERDIFNLRNDPRNFDRRGNLTPQALDIEARLLDIAGLRANAAQLGRLTPSVAPSVPFGGPIPGLPSGAIGSTQITINAQGSWWDSPDRLNQLGRLVEDSIARRSGLTNTYTRR